MLHWFTGSLLHWFTGSLHVALVHWFTACCTGSLLYWFTGSLHVALVHCCTGSLVHCMLHWFTVALVHCMLHWFTVALLHWFTGSLLHWFTVALLHWFTVALVHWSPLHWLTRIQRYKTHCAMSPWSLPSTGVMHMASYSLARQMAWSVWQLCPPRSWQGQSDSLNARRHQSLGTSAQKIKFLQLCYSATTRQFRYGT